MPAGITSLRGLRVLVVEDQAVVALDLQCTLEAVGAAVVGPYLGLRQALGAAESGAPIDAAILDVDLAQRSVFPLADRLAARGVPLVFHTGRADLDQIHARYPDAIVLLKPSRPEDVTYQLGGVVAAARPSRALEAH